MQTVSEQLKEMVVNDRKGHKIGVSHEDKKQLARNGCSANWWLFMAKTAAETLALEKNVKACDAEILHAAGDLASYYVKLTLE